MSFDKKILRVAVVVCLAVVPLFALVRNFDFSSSVQVWGSDESTHPQPRRLLVKGAGSDVTQFDGPFDGIIKSPEDTINDIVSFASDVTPYVAATWTAAAPAPSPIPEPQLPPPTPPSPAPSPAGCPPDPSTCDFYLVGYQGSLPTIPLKGAQGDPTLAQVALSIEGEQIIPEAVNTGNFTMECPTDTSVYTKYGPQFYITQSALKSRTFQPPALWSPFVGKLIKLWITTAEIVLADNFVINLNPGDGNTDFPESARCVMFYVSA